MKNKKKVSSKMTKATKKQRNNHNSNSDPFKTPPSFRSKVIIKKVKKSQAVPVVEQSDASVQTAPPGKPLATEKKKNKSVPIPVVYVPISDDSSPSEEIDYDDDDIWYKKVFDVGYHQPHIIENMLIDEKKHRPNRHYIRKQNNLTNKDRSKLINWMVKVASYDELDDETLYLAVSYLDRYLSMDKVPESYINLLGAAVLYIAVKYEEYDDAFEFLTGDNYGKQEVVIMEKIVLLTLSCQLCTPTAFIFIRTYAEMCAMPAQLMNLTMYISELALTLMNAKTLMRFLPSKMAFASHALARHILGMKMWTAKLEAISTYKLCDIANLARKLSLVHKSATNHIRQATRVKFSGMDYKRVSRIQAVVLTTEVLEKLSASY
ncbi:hypothetical protein KR032_000894 [Drosophila birchii]|nr:hypothetical protein KR032_000894 [Drosophila birchii]